MLKASVRSTPPLVLASTLLRAPGRYRRGRHGRHGLAGVWNGLWAGVLRPTLHDATLGLVR